MQIAKQYLHTTQFTLLENWSVQYFIGNKFSYNKKYDLVRIGDFLKRNKTSIDIQDVLQYKRVTIKINNGGVFLRDTEKGENIGTKKQFVIKKGQFLLSKIDARNGAFGVVPEEVDGAIITGNFWTFDVDYSKINPHFLSLITTTSEFISFSENASNGTTNRHYLQEDLFLNQKIPLPSIDEQNRIIKNYNEKIKKAEEHQNKADELEKGIESYLFEELGIRRKKEENKIKGIHFINYKNITKWGVEYNIDGLKKGILQSSIYNNFRLSELVYINPQTKLPKTDEEITFLPMECISDKTGEIKEYRKGIVSKSKGYTKFQEGDLIWARITPCMENGKSAIVKNLINNVGYGSTEYHVLREKREDFNINFLYQLLRTESLRKNAISHFTGSAGQQRVPKSYLEELEVPLPSIHKQSEIVETINKIKSEIENLKKLSEQNRKTAEQEFEKEIFS